MNKSNHKKITLEALTNSDYGRNARLFIAGANQDSDHQSGPAGDEGQHFCGSDSPQNIVDKCGSFINDTVDTAALLARRGHPQETIDALYFLGRALHCVQDFYAHSNWIALGKSTCWNSKPDPSNLKFCSSTPDWIPGLFGTKTLWGPMGNLSTYKAEKSSTSDEGKKLWKKLKEQRFSKEDDIIHPFMHLDCGGSFADRVISYHGKIGGGGAYKRAHDLAKKDSKFWLSHFRFLLKKNKYNPETPGNKQIWPDIMDKLPSALKARYGKSSNRGQTDATTALRNMQTINPFAEKGDSQIGISREVFYYLMGVSSNPYKNKYKFLDFLFGPRSLVG